MSASRELFISSDDFIVIKADIDDSPSVEIPLMELFDLATFVISSQVASAHARGCRWEIGWSTIVQEGAHERIPKNGMRFTRQWRSAFVVLAT